VIAIRPTKSSDLPTIQQIELAAGELFRAIGMTDIADHPVPTIEVLAGFQRAGRSWVAVDEADQPVGFILVKLVDARVHIEQVSIHPDCARRRIGRDLVDHVENWAAAQGISALSLTTFRDVQWNGPYYERLGFAELSPPDWGPELAALMADEAEHGLDPELRIAMVRPIHQSR
jgi:GNAT superfamily N-acetyltransferase